MRNIIILILVFFPLWGFCQNVSLEQLEERDNNIFYLISSGEAYTGICIGKYSNGQKKYEGYFKKGIPEKSWTEYDEDGFKIFEATYKYAKFNGTGTYYYPYGQIKEQGTYKNGRKIGKWVEWDAYGKISKDKNYETVYEWYSKDLKKSEGTLKDGRKHDSWNEYYESKVLKHQSNYYENKKNGKEVSWFENGKKASEKNWNNDTLNGSWVEYYDNGQLKISGKMLSNYRD
ncbi:MAG: hypothetical protein COZ59_06100, partial [Bacteroidetes bacterium CG_4_8_14_3_um_filter_31_14]